MPFGTAQLYVELQLSAQSGPALRRLAKQRLAGLCWLVSQENREQTPAARCLAEALKGVIVLGQLRLAFFQTRQRAVHKPASS